MATDSQPAKSKIVIYNKGFADETWYDFQMGEDSLEIII